MNASKLFKAAKLLKTSKPALSKEIMRVAQEMQGDMPTNDLQTTVDQPQQHQTQAPSAAGETQYFNSDQAEGKTSHEVSFSFDVPAGTDKTKIINYINKSLSQMLAEQNINMYAFSFKERTKN